MPLYELFDLGAISFYTAVMISLPANGFYPVLMLKTFEWIGIEECEMW